MIFERATGWLGYTPREALESNVNDLMLALNGRQGLLKQMFGSGEVKGSPKPKKMTGEGWRAMVKAHNAQVRGKRDGTG